MKCRAFSSVCPVVLCIVSWAATGCDTQPRPNSYYEEYDLFGSSATTETNTDWRNHQREREAQAKWERDRTYYDYDYRQHHRDGW